MQQTYDVFGLVIQSDFVLDALSDTELSPEESAARPVDLTVRRVTGLTRDSHPPIDPYFDITPEVQYFHWRAVGSFLIETPSSVLIEPHADVSDHLVSQALLGLVISIVLERQQLLCLHASAVNVNGHAVIFLGDKGAGKSTTSGALLAKGHLPITDDLVAVEADARGDLVIRPGFSRMKLWPDSIAALGMQDRDGDRLIHPEVTKIQKEMPVPIPRHNVPISAAFVLKRAEGVQQTEAQRLPAHQALQMLLRYTFMARYGETKLGRDHLIAHMKRCSAMVSNIPVYDLNICPDLGQLGHLADTIAEVAAQSAEKAQASA